jgi:signal peptidase I
MYQIDPHVRDISTPQLDPISEKKPQQKEEHPFWEVVKFTFISLIIVIPIRLFIIQPFIVSGDSMNPTLSNRNYLIVDQLQYRVSDPQRGDVIVFRFPKQESRFLIKRIIALPGETIDIQNGIVTVLNDEHPNGIILDEPYVNNKTTMQSHVVLDAKEYFVMGDNRQNSSDSRSWGILSERHITGRALVRLFPLRSATLLPGDRREELSEI